MTLHPNRLRLPFLALVCLLGWQSAGYARIQPTTVDLDIGKTEQVTLHDGSKAAVKRRADSFMARQLTADRAREFYVSGKATLVRDHDVNEIKKRLESPGVPRCFSPRFKTPIP